MSHLNREQRYKILGLLCCRYTQAQIADIIGCSQSTISRELKRNSSRGKYGAEAAQEKPLRRAHLPSRLGGQATWRQTKAGLEKLEAGANENMNGLIRQFIPKGAKIEDVDERHIRWVEDSLNNRPRKRLDYLTPNELFLKKFNIMR